jgi:glucosamine--fructose-6-phosphate aminotransferase (isomerizing)
MASKDGYKHFMLKEIYEQPRAIMDTFEGRLLEKEGDVRLEGVFYDNAALQTVQRVVIVACGTSWHAALTGKFLIETHCRIPVEVDLASEFSYRNPIVDARTLVIAITQSGETADTLAALRTAVRLGTMSLAICNVQDSTIAREAAGVIYTHAGPEIGVASTKVFVTQLEALYLLTIRLGRATGKLDLATGQKMIADLKKVPKLVEQALQLDNMIEQVAARFVYARNCIYLGRGRNYPVALEGALKLKETSYIHAEGYPSGEFRHGPIALIDKDMPVVVLVPQNSSYERAISNLEEVTAMDGHVIAICSEGDSRVKGQVETTLELQLLNDDLDPMILAVPIQLLAYHIAVRKGTDVDQPRNLVKSVTSE